MQHDMIVYPNLEEERAAAHFDLLTGIIEGRIIPSPRHDGEYVYDPEKLEDDEHDRAITAFDYEIYNLLDEGLIVIDDRGTPEATDEGHAWFDQMQLDLEAIIALDEGRLYLVPKPHGHDGYLHAYDPTEHDEFDGSTGLDLTHLRDHGVIDWEGDMIAFITSMGGRFLATYRPELFQPAAA